MEEPRTCIECGKELKPGFKLCPYCGTKQEPEGKAETVSPEPEIAEAPSPPPEETIAPEKPEVPLEVKEEPKIEEPPMEVPEIKAKPLGTLTKEDKLSLLEERYSKGEVSDKTYKMLRKKYGKVRGPRKAGLGLAVPTESEAAAPTPEAVSYEPEQPLAPSEPEAPSEPPEPPRAEEIEPEVKPEALPKEVPEVEAKPIGMLTDEDKLSLLEERYSKGEVSEKTYQMLRKKYGK